jgi:hypothetical protein
MIHQRVPHVVNIDKTGREDPVDKFCVSIRWVLELSRYLQERFEGRECWAGEVYNRRFILEEF